MNEAPKVSIVTAVYNGSSTIGGTIESVGRQTHQNLEHIIQDGGSVDGTIEKIRDFSMENVTIFSGPDGGIYDAINKGIASSSGDIVGLVHSDDFLAHDRVIERVVAAFADPEIQGVYGDLDYVSASDPTRIIRHWRAGAFTPRKLAWGWMPPHPTLFLRRKVFEDHGVYDVSYRIAADYDAILRWFGRGRIRSAYIPEVLVKMRVGGKSNRSLGNILLKSREDYRALRSHKMGGLGTLAAKNFSKISQFIFK